LYALNTSTNGKELWTTSTLPEEQNIPIVTDPVITNGLVFFGAKNGWIYVFGRYVKPTEQISGSITSVPIRLPEGYWWKKFHVKMQTNLDPKINKITFSLLDEQKNLIKILTNDTDLSVQNMTLNRTLRLRADFWAKNSSVNPQLLFWNVTFYKDSDPPFIDMRTLTPYPDGWLNEVLPYLTVNVIDNDTGLLISSARYTVEYIIQNQTYWSTDKAVCTGVNGTTEMQKIIVNLSQLNFYPNITALRSLRINISDLAGNTESEKATFFQDTIKPTSYIKIEGMKRKYNSTYVRINATAYDNGTQNVNASGIKQVELYYRFSEKNNFSGDWIYFANSAKLSPTWKFNFTNRPNQQGGYFELCTRAIDKANNTENFPSTGDIWFLYDWRTPDLPSVSGDTLWFKERPQFSVVFEDDYRLDTIQYRPNLDTVWTTLASDVNLSIYNTDTVGHSWILPESYWNQMEEGEIYYLYFRINDTLGNTLQVLNNNQAIIIRKDISTPIVIIDVPSAEIEYSWTDNFTVSGFGNDHNGSGIKEALLYYRFSEDQSDWSSWTTYGDMLDSSPFEWDFDATEGDGYYEVKINATDYAGNTEESDVITIVVTSFPTTLALVLVGLIVILIFISIIVYINWRKKESP
jgi:hypothetical protein